eukprot:2984525-Ditylum_brightwellii.AAC.1
MQEELSVQKMLLAEREVSLCQAHKDEFDSQKLSFFKRESSLSKSHNEKIQAKMENMKTLLCPGPTTRPSPLGPHY